MGGPQIRHMKQDMKQFLAVTFLVALLGSYAFPDSGHVPEDEFEWSVTELTQEQQNTDFVSIFAQLDASTDSLNKLEGAMRNLSKFASSRHQGAEKKLVNLLEAKSHNDHDEKLKATIAKKSELKALVDGIQSTLKSEYAEHKKSAEAAIATLTEYKNGLTETQFKPLVAGAKNWCAAWKKQQSGLGVISAKEKEMKTAKAANIKAPKEWQKACEWGVSYSKGDTYSEKQFAATSTFQQEFDTARKTYWETVKAHFNANEEHNGQITESNNAAVAFKTAIHMLAVFEVNACKTRDRKGQKDIVDGFNTANAKRAAVYRSLEVIHCHVEHLDSETDKVKSNTENCVAKVKTESDYQNEHFKDLTVPNTNCPSYEDVLKNIKDKYPKLDFHFLPNKEGDTAGWQQIVATDADGKLKPNQGWVPSDPACEAIDNHNIKGSTCDDHKSECPNDKVYNDLAKDKLVTKAQVATTCCKDKTCANFACPEGKKKKSNVDALKPPNSDKCCESSAKFGEGTPEITFPAKGYDRLSYKNPVGTSDGQRFWAIHYSNNYACDKAPPLIMQSVDKGKTWTKNTAWRKAWEDATFPKLVNDNGTPTSENHQQTAIKNKCYMQGMAASSDGKALYATTQRRLFVSRDYGSSWQVVSDVIAQGYVQYFNKPEVSSDGKIVYVPMSGYTFVEGISGQVTQLWRSKDSGKSWVKINVGGNAKTEARGHFVRGCVSGDGKTLWQAGGHLPAVSTDYGETFEYVDYFKNLQTDYKTNKKLNMYWGGITCNQDATVLALNAKTSKRSEQDHTIIVYGALLWTSSDGGGSWSEKVLPCMDNSCSIRGGIRFCGSDTNNIVIGSYDQSKPSDSKTRKPNPGSQGIAVSNNFGAKWTILSGTGLASYGGYSNFACKSDGSLLIAAALYVDKTNPINAEFKNDPNKAIAGMIVRVEFK